MRKIIVKLKDSEQIIDIPDDIEIIVFKDDNCEDLCAFKRLFAPEPEFKEWDILAIETNDKEPDFIVLFKGWTPDIRINNRELRNIDSHLILSNHSGKTFRNSRITVWPYQKVRQATAKETTNFYRTINSLGYILHYIPLTKEYKLIYIPPNE